MSETGSPINSQYPSFSRAALIWALALFSAFTALLIAMTIYLFSEKELNYSFRLEQTLHILKQVQPESYHGHRMMVEARDALIQQLDRYSDYLAPRELNRVAEEFSGSYGGIGIIVVGDELGLQIMSVREDGPAGRAGLRTGDIIIRANSLSLKGLNSDEATYHLRGPEGSPVAITVIRNEMADTLTFSLIRERLRLIHIAYAGLTPGGSLYMRILDFESGCSEDFRAAMDSLFIKNRDSVKGIIIDLRGNPGGLVHEAIQMADYFLDRGHLIVGVKGRSRWRNYEFRSSGKDLTGGLPLAIIVDRGSASASEIFAGAMKYSHRGFLTGDTTFGKGLVQEFDSFGDGSGLRLTTSRYYFEGNIFINKPSDSVLDSAAGIPPDYNFSWIENELFPLRLENSLLPRNFALAHRDEIVPDSGRFTLSPQWFESFVAFARSRHFHFESEMTREIKFALASALVDENSPETIASLKNLYALSYRDDSLQFDHYRDLINQRLYQIALELKYGTGAAYRDAILPYRRDISIIERLFDEKKRP